MLLIVSIIAMLFAVTTGSITGETASRRTELVPNLEVNSTFEHQLEKLLETSGNLSLIEIRQKVDELVAKTDAETRKRHEQWKIEQHTRDNERRERIKDAIMKLSKPAQAKLIRIIFIQEDEELTQNEKRARLSSIAQNMSKEIREELVNKLRDSDIFTEFGFY